MNIYIYIQATDTAQVRAEGEGATTSRHQRRYHSGRPSSRMRKPPSKQRRDLGPQGCLSLRMTSGQTQVQWAALSLG